MMKIEITKAETDVTQVLEVPDMVTGIALLHDILEKWANDIEEPDVCQIVITR